MRRSSQPIVLLFEIYQISSKRMTCVLANRWGAVSRADEGRIARGGALAQARKSNLPGGPRRALSLAGGPRELWRAAFDDSITLRRKRHRMPEEDSCSERRAERKMHR